MKICETTVIAKRAGVLETTIGSGETVLLGPDGDSYFGLEGTAASIWAQLDSPLTVGDLYDRLAEKYAVGGEALKADVRPFLDELLTNMLIEACEPG